MARDPALTAPGPPFPAATVATLLVMAGDVMLFAGLSFALWVLRLAAPVWPPPLQPRLPLALTTANTLVLAGSSVAVAIAMRALHRRDSRRLVRSLAAGAALGALFLAVQGYEWTRLIGFGLTVSSGTYGALFYTLIGAHAVHVAAALAWLLATLAVAAGGRRAAGAAARARACALYWHFVVAVWPWLYLSVYVL